MGYGQADLQRVVGTQRGLRQLLGMRARQHGILVEHEHPHVGPRHAARQLWHHTGQRQADIKQRLESGAAVAVVMRVSRVRSRSHCCFCNKSP